MRRMPLVKSGTKVRRMLLNGKRCPDYIVLNTDYAGNVR